MEAGKRDLGSRSSSSSSNNMETLMEDALESVLGRLPVRDLVKATGVCSDWRRIINSSALVRRSSDSRQQRQPWLFVVDAHAGSLKAFDPISSTWLPPLPLPLRPSPAEVIRKSVQAAAGDPGLLYEIAGGRLRYGWATARGVRWQETPPMRWWRLNPVVCYVHPRTALLVAGGAWELDDDDAQDSCVEILSLGSGDWEPAEPLPRSFRSLTSSKMVRAASDGAGDRMFLLQESGGRLLCASFHMGLRRWSAACDVRLPDSEGLLPRTLSLVGGTARGLLVAGLTAADGACRAFLWQLAEDTGAGADMPAVLLCEMPRNMVAAVVGLLQADVLDPAWYSLMCVGAGDLVFFHSDRTDVVALCHLPSLSWSTFTVDDDRLGCGAGGIGVNMSMRMLMPCYSFKTFVCAPVTLDQVIPAFPV